MQRLIQGFIGFLVLLGLLLPVSAEEGQGKKPGGKKDKGKKEAITKTGLIDFETEAKGDNKDAVFLKVGSETFKLLTGKRGGLLEALKKLKGKETTVRGGFLPPDERNPLPAIRVGKFQEGKEISEGKKPQGEVLTKTGVLEVKPAPVFLVVDGEEVKVSPGAGGPEMVEKLTTLSGKRVVLKGEFFPKNEKRKNAVLRLESFEEAK